MGSAALTFLSTRVLGVRLQRPAWALALRVEPHLGNISDVTGVVCTEMGTTGVAWSLTGGAWGPASTRSVMGVINTTVAVVPIAPAAVASPATTAFSALDGSGAVPPLGRGITAPANARSAAAAAAGAAAPSWREAGGANAVTITAALPLSDPATAPPAGVTDLQYFTLDFGNGVVMNAATAVTQGNATLDADRRYLRITRSLPAVVGSALQWQFALRPGA